MNSTENKDKTKDFINDMTKTIINKLEKKKINPLQNKQLSQEPSTSKEFTESVNNKEIKILNKENKIEIINFSSDEMLESIQLEDSTVEIIGFIDEIDGPKIVGKAQHYRLLKFILNNNSRHRIQVVAWNSEVERIQFHLQPNRIIHIDGAKAKQPKILQFNQGTLPYELIVRSNTIINSLGSFNLKQMINAVRPKLIDLSNIPNHLNSCVRVQGFIKTSLNTFSNNFKTIGYGSITDKIYKLEIQILDFEPNDSISKGVQVEVNGYIKIANDVFYLEVEKTSDIKIIGNEILPFPILLQRSKSIVKRSLPNEFSELSTNKIIRK